MSKPSPLEALGDNLGEEFNKQDEAFKGADEACQKVLEAAKGAINLGATFIRDPGHMSIAIGYGPPQELVMGSYCLPLSQKYLDELNQERIEKYDAHKAAIAGNKDDLMFFNVLHDRDGDQYTQITYSIRKLYASDKGAKNKKNGSIKEVLQRSYLTKNYAKLGGAGDDYFLSPQDFKYEYSPYYPDDGAGIRIEKSLGLFDLQSMLGYRAVKADGSGSKLLYELQDMFQGLYSSLSDCASAAASTATKVNKILPEELGQKVRNIKEQMLAKQLELQKQWESIIPSPATNDNMGPIAKEMQAQLEVLTQLKEVQNEARSLVFSLVSSTLNLLRQRMSEDAFKAMIKIEDKPVRYARHRLVGSRNKTYNIPIAQWEDSDWRKYSIEMPPPHLGKKTLLANPVGWQPDFAIARQFLEHLPVMLATKAVKLHDEATELRPVATKGLLDKDPLNL